MRFLQDHHLLIPTSFTLFIIGIIIVLFITLLASLIIRSDTLRIAITYNIIFVSFVRFFLVQFDMASLIPLVAGISMVLITLICNVVRGRDQPGWLYLLFLFLIGCFFGITIPFLFNLWFTAVLEHLSVELEGVVELIADVLAPIAVGMNISDLLNPAPSGSTRGTTGTASGASSGSTGATGAAGNANNVPNPLQGGAAGNANNVPNPLQGGAATGLLGIPDPEGKFSRSYNPRENNTFILNNIREALQRRYDAKASLGIYCSNLTDSMFTHDQYVWITQFLLHEHPDLSHKYRSKGNRYGNPIDLRTILNTRVFRDKFR